MSNDDFRRLMTAQHPLDADDMATADALLANYPYLQALRAIRLKTLLATGKAKDGSETNDAIYLPDRKRFYAWAMNGWREEQRVQEPAGSRTLDLIDSFLNMASQHNAGDDAHDSSDESHHFTAGEQQQHLMLQATAPKQQPMHSDGHAQAGGDYSLDEENIDEACFTETLAKIYAKQGRYEKALEIIRKLSLKYPKKNTYFAGQIKTLEELINNNKTETN